MKFSQPVLRAGDDGDGDKDTLLNEGDSAGLLGDGLRTAAEEEAEPPGDTTISVKKSNGLFDCERPRTTSGLDGEEVAATGTAVANLGDDVGGFCCSERREGDDEPSNLLSKSASFISSDASASSSPCEGCSARTASA